MTVSRRLSAGLVLFSLTAFSACKDEQTKVAEAAARIAERTQVLAPDDVQIVSTDGRTALEIIGMKMFEVGDGKEGATFRQADALQFVAVVLDRQNQIEMAGKTP